MGRIDNPWTVIDPVFRGAGLRQVAQVVMQMVASDWNDSVPVDVADPAVLAVLDRHRISTLIPMSAIAEDQRESFRERLLTIYGSQMRIQATAIDVLERFQAAGIESRVLKGLASSELDYPSMELRHTGDVDLAVRPDELDAAVELLGQSGYRRRPDPDRSPHTFKGATLVGPRGIEVDLHDRLFVRSRPSQILFDEPGVAMSSLPGSAFGTELRLVNAAGAFAMTPNGHKRMSGLVDVHRILESQTVDHDKVRGLAAELHLSGPVGQVLKMEAVCFSRSNAAYGDWPPLSWLDRQVRFDDRRRFVLEHVARLRAVPVSELPGYLPIWMTPNAKDRMVMRRVIESRRRRLRSMIERAR